MRSGHRAMKHDGSNALANRMKSSQRIATLNVAVIHPHAQDEYDRLINSSKVRRDERLVALLQEIEKADEVNDENA